MPSSRALSSVRTRFAATAAVVFALVAMGGVTAAPAAADVSATVSVVDGSRGGAALDPPYQAITLHHVDGDPYVFGGGYQNSFSTSPGPGGGPGPVPDGDYYITVTDGSYAASDTFHMDGNTSNLTVTVDKFAVTGSIAADAGATPTTIQRNVGGNWSTVGSASANTAFTLRLPAGPAEYRLLFQPAVATGYVETLSPSFVIDGTLKSFDLGPVTLNRTPSISGTILAADDSAPLADATVHATIADVEVATALTNGSGNYTINLPAGDANYSVWAEAYGYDRVDYAQPVAVNPTAGVYRESINFALAGSLVDITGTVGNYYSFNSPVSIQLYSGGSAPVQLAQTTLDPDSTTGAYSFTGVASGDYFIKFVPGGNDSYLPTLLGDSGGKAWASTPAVEAAFALNNSFTVDVGDPSTASGKYVVLDWAASLEGSLRSTGNVPIDGCVLITDVNDPTFSVCAEMELPTTDPDSTGWWSIRVPVGHSFTLYASGLDRKYTPQWWADQTPVGPVVGGSNGYQQFFLQLSPATLEVTATDVTSADAITAFVYYKESGSGWRLLGSSGTPAAFIKDYNSKLDEGLTPGDYRIRFQNSSGTWLAATSVDGPMCFIDLTGITDGSPTVVSATFDSANQTQLCGPEVLSSGDVTGHVVSSPTFGSVDVTNHAVEIYNERGRHTATSGSDGSFSYGGLSNDTYSIEVQPTEHVAGQHEYTYRATGVELGDGDVDLGDLVATRYGNVSGTISDWDPVTMAGATVTVYYYDTAADCGCWTPGSISTTVSSTGVFEVAGVDADGDYGVMVDFRDTYAPGFLGGGSSAPTYPFAGVAEQDYSLGAVPVNAQRLVTISGTVVFGSHPVVGGSVVALANGAVESGPIFAEIDNEGHYEIEVAPNVSYAVIAIAGDRAVQVQTYGGFNYEPDDLNDPDLVLEYTPVVVGGADVADIDFSLVAIAAVDFDLYLYTGSAATHDYNDFAGVTVHLYQNVEGTWQQLSTFAAEDDDDEAYGQALGDGDYRLRFSRDGVWLPTHELYSWLGYPYAEDAEESLAFDPAQCYVEFDDVQHGSSVYAEIGLLPSVASVCDPDAPVIPPAVPGTPVKPGTVKPHRATTLAATAEDATRVDSAEPTPTSTPTPSPSETPADEPSDAPVAAAPVAASSPDLAWLFWTAGVLVLAVLVGGGVLIFRRRVL